MMIETEARSPVPQFSRQRSSRSQAKRRGVLSPALFAMYWMRSSSLSRRRSLASLYVDSLRGTFSKKENLGISFRFSFSRAPHQRPPGPMMIVVAGIRRATRRGPCCRPLAELARCLTRPFIELFSCNDAPQRAKGAADMLLQKFPSEGTAYFAIRSASCAPSPNRICSTLPVQEPSAQVESCQLPISPTAPQSRGPAGKHRRPRAGRAARPPRSFQPRASRPARRWQKIAIDIPRWLKPGRSRAHVLFVSPRLWRGPNVLGDALSISSRPDDRLSTCQHRHALKRLRPRQSRSCCSDRRAALPDRANGMTGDEARCAPSRTLAR
jgi:hypothetical protein